MSEHHFDRSGDRSSPASEACCTEPLHFVLRVDYRSRVGIGFPPAPLDMELCTL